VMPGILKDIAIVPVELSKSSEKPCPITSAHFGNGLTFPLNLARSSSCC
jgi:hypothetical protein